MPFTEGRLWKNEWLSICGFSLPRSKKRKHKVKEKHFQETGQTASVPNAGATSTAQETGAPAAGSLQSESLGELSQRQQLDRHGTAT